MDTSSKEVLLELCRKIKAAKPETINILRNQPLCNLKIVQRKSKNVKDPNPLASMMSAITTKYPLSVDKEKAIKAGVPNEFLFKEDAHQHGRILCKLEAVDWYVNTAAVPDENTQKAIDILYENKKKQVAFYFSHQWERARIVFGQMNIKRSLINTQEVSVKIPHFQKSEYIMACLMPQYVLDYGDLNQSVLNELKALRDLSLVSKMTIQSQLRILINTLDSKPRFIPIVKNFPESVNRIRHAFASTMYKIEVPQITSSSTESYKNLFDQLGRILYILLQQGENHKKIFSLFRKAKYKGNWVVDLMVNDNTLEGTFINYFLIFMCQPILQSSKIRDFSFYPIEGKTYASMRMNKVKGRYTMYEGSEKVYVEGSNIRGLINRYDDLILGLNLLKSDAYSIKEVIFAVAEYCKVFFSETRQKQLFRIKRDAREMYKKKPWGIVGATKEDWPRILKNESRGNVMFSDEIDQIRPNRISGTVSLDKITLHNGSVIMIEPGPRPNLLPEDFFIEGSMFNDFMAPPHMFRRKIQYNMANYTTICQMIVEENFSYKNETVMNGVPNALRLKVGLTAQSMIRLAVAHEVNPLIVCFLYLFSGVEPGIIPSSQYKDIFYWYESYKVNFNMHDGIFSIVDDKIHILNEPYESRPSKGIGNYLPCILPGYKILPQVHEHLEFKSVQYLRKAQTRISLGKTFNVSLFGKTFTVVRDPSTNASLYQTMTRNLQSIAKTTLFDNMMKLSNSIKRRVDEDDDNCPSTSKRVRIETDDNESQGSEGMDVGDEELPEVDWS